MELTFLGTSAGTPTSTRNVSGLALRIGGRWDLFDCGEATQHRLMHTALTLPRLRRVFISHLHGDHCFGLFGLLGSRSMNASQAPLTVYGPHGLSSMLETVLDASSTHLSFPLDVREIGPDGGRLIDDSEITVDAVPLRHRVTSFAWWMREQPRPGRFDIAAAHAAGVPEGPLFGRLQRGEAVELADGRRVGPDGVLGSARRGRSIVIAGDNSDPVALFDHTGGADVVVHEATYTEPVLAVLGDDHGHSTAARVAIAAEQAGVTNLILTHFSLRYADATATGSTSHTITEVGDEARRSFHGGLHLARDFDRVTISSDGSTISSSRDPSWNPQRA